MKLAALAALLLLASAPAGFAQPGGAPRIAEVNPYANVAPGQIIELRVEHLGEQLLSPPPGDALRILLTQDGETRAAHARTATPVFARTTPPAGGAAPPDPSSGELKAFQGMSFVVPKGLRPGEAEVVVEFRGRRSAPFKLNVVARPERPRVGGTPMVSITPGSPLPAPRPGEAATRERLGLRFERGAKGAELYVRPLADPEDAEAGVLVRFKQGGAFYDANARVVHREGGRERLPRGVGVSVRRDVLELDVPEMLAPGEAELEIALRAGGQTGEAALVPVTITDAARAFESPQAAAPRLLSVAPQRVGAGQALLLSVDRRLTLEPDPSKAVVVFETPDGATRREVAPEMNSVTNMPSTPSDAPVFLVVRAPADLTGALRLRLVNPARADYEGAASEPAAVEVLREAVAPEVQGAAEADAGDMARLRELGAARPDSRYVSIRVTGIDPNPKFLRVRFEQEGRAAATLGEGDLILFTGQALVVRLPEGFAPGPTRVSVENRGASGYSAPAAATFELSGRR